MVGNGVFPHAFFDLKERTVFHAKLTSLSANFHTRIQREPVEWRIDFFRAPLLFAWLAGRDRGLLQFD
jgi:hypothetical protein